MKMDTYTAQEKPIIVSLRHSSTLGNDTYINGGLRGLNMLETTRKSHLNAYIGASIGRYMATGINNRFKGWVAEVIMYNRYLSETERKAVESYLSTKYAITVASTASPEHYTNMFELAVSASPTTQTKESGGLTIKGDYKAAAARIRAGHDNAEGIAATFNPNSSTYPDFYRLKREWFLNIIGILDAKFSFDLDDLGLSDINPSGNKYCLLFRNDSKNNFTVIDSVATINGKVISFTRSSLTSVTHNGFYTLGTLDNDESSLPIELSSFLGALTLENNVRLQWITQSETGVSGFYLLRNISKELNNALQISSLIPANNSSGMSYYDFTDTELSENGTYYYWLQCLNLDSSTSLYGPVTVVYQPNGDVTVPELPIITGISSTYPNPFNPSINIAYSIKESADVQMKVFNLKGQMLKQWSYPKQTSGRNTLVWDAKDLPSGVYLLSFEAGDFKQTKRITLAK